MSSLSPAEVFRRIVEGVSGGQWEDLPALWADPTDVRHPMSSLPPLRSADDMRAHFARAAAATARLKFRPEVLAIHETGDPEVIVAEFEYRGANRETQTPFTAACVFVMRVRDGKVVESRDYIDHAAFARALAG
jgi:uncharacterized protein